jgi:hypothetical protein
MIYLKMKCNINTTGSGYIRVTAPGFDKKIKKVSFKKFGCDWFALWKCINQFSVLVKRNCTICNVCEWWNIDRPLVALLQNSD